MEYDLIFLGVVKLPYIGGPASLMVSGNTFHSQSPLVKFPSPSVSLTSLIFRRHG